MAHGDSLARVIPFPQSARVTTLADRAREVFADVLPRAWPGYAARAGQIEMLDEVSGRIDGGGHALIEAPCGTGKSLAYLVPAILRARATGRAAIVATASIALQEQLIQKDLPSLNAAMPGGVTFALLKGRQNYLCQNTLADEVPVYLSAEERAELARVDAWAEQTKTGDRAELPFIVSDGVWGLRSVTTDDCLRDGCAHYDACHTRAAKARAESVDVIVVNMHLLAAHMAVHMEMCQDAVIPRTGPRESATAWDTIILDEAHELGDVARDFFGAEITEGRFARIARWMRSENLNGDPLKRAAAAFFADIDTRIPLDDRGKPEPVRIREGLDAEALKDLLDDARAAARKVAASIAPKHKAGTATREEVAAMRKAESAVRRCARLGSWLEAVITPAESPEVVLWIERTSKGVPVLQGRHLEAGEILRWELWARARTLIATSATLTTGARPKLPDAWHWIRRQLGAPAEARALAVASPFDFAAQARLVLPRLPDPRKEREAFDAAVCEVTTQVARGALRHGGVLGLFTSRRMSDRAAAALRDRGVGPVYAQGERPRHELLAAMRAAPGVLCGTASLWTGVDLQGSACVAVIVDKLPFPPPGDPVMEAIGERLTASTGDQWAAFREEQLPRAVLRLRQGVGRLIRATGDRGIVVVCDPRLTSARYGREVVSTLGLPVQVASVGEALSWL